MAELINFDNLRQVLEDFAQDFKTVYREELERSDRFTKYGQDRLIDFEQYNEVSTMVQQGDQAWTVTINLNKYWKYVEEGLQGSGNPTSPYKNPGWKAFPHILNWVTIKPVIPRPNNKGKLPSPKSLAYLITRKIKDEGTDGSRDFENAKQVVVQRFRERIAEAVGHDFENYIRKVVAG